eukprot:jgi/Chlat1/4903/Chrsp31S04819
MLSWAPLLSLWAKEEAAAVMVGGGGGAGVHDGGGGFYPAKRARVMDTAAATHQQQAAGMDDGRQQAEASAKAMEDFTRARLIDNSPTAERPVEQSTGAEATGAAAAHGNIAPDAAASPVVKTVPASDLLAVPVSGAYAQREDWLQQQEERGELEFKCLKNDGGDVQAMVHLIGLKNIFSKQLPNMPKEYIVRLVLDRNHRSMTILKKGNIVGGITYRYFPQGFGEIAFCAITATEQVKGYGTRLMNHLKQYARDEDHLTHFLTYADNNAVGYFAKQGFTKEITMERERWHGYIKDYDGGTLMECILRDKLPYTKFPTIIRQQRQAVEARIRELSGSHVVYEGLDLFKQGRTVPIEKIPGIKSTGWTKETHAQPKYRLVTSSGGDGVPTLQALYAFMASLLKAALEHPDAWPFREPVDKRDVPDYYDIVKDPVDLSKIQARMERHNYYVTLEIFLADFHRMFVNARTYNNPDTIYYKCANRLESFLEMKVQSGIQMNRTHRV